MPIQYFSELQIITLALILVRVSSFLVAFPLVEGGNIPNSAKVLLSLIISIVLYGVVPKAGITEAFITENLVFMIIKEALIGVLIGFIARLFFQAVSTAGDIVTMSVGLSSDQMFNPTIGRRVTSIETYQLMLASLLFLALNGHHFFIEGLVKSFELIPMSEQGLNLIAFRDLTLVGQIVLEMGIKLAAPVMGAIFIANVALGIIGRTVPQINVLITSWPINIILGFAVMIITLPLLLVSLSEMIQWNASYLMEFLKAL